MAWNGVMQNSVLIALLVTAAAHCMKNYAVNFHWIPSIVDESVQVMELKATDIRRNVETTQGHRTKLGSCSLIYSFICNVFNEAAANWRYTPVAYKNWKTVTVAKDVEGSGRGLILR
jgi:hypothetical protein